MFSIEMADESDKIKIIVRNRKARHEYELMDRFEAGVSLLGPEVKSLRLGKANITDTYATVDEDGLILRNLHISPYEMAASQALDPARPRRLLLHKREIRKIAKLLAEKGLTLVPLQIYFKNNLVKIELAVARGRKKHDKREAIAKREAERETRRAAQRDR